MEQTIQQMIDKRQEANRQILEKLQTAVEKYPNLRFGQILYNFDIIPQNRDIFYVESVESLQALEKSSFGQRLLGSDNN